MQADRLEEIADDYTRAWNSGAPDAVAAFYAEAGHIAINGAAPWEGREGVAAMAAGFFADVPDLSLTCDGTPRRRRPCRLSLDLHRTRRGDGKAPPHFGMGEVGPRRRQKGAASLGWFDAADYARQVAG